MVITLLTKSHTYIVDDPEELTIEAPDGITFDARNEDGVQIYKWKEAEE